MRGDSSCFFRALSWAIFGHELNMILSEHYNTQTCPLDVDNAMVTRVLEEMNSKCRCFLRLTNSNSGLLNHSDLIASGGPGPEVPLFRCDDETSMQVVTKLCVCVTPRYLSELVHTCLLRYLKESLALQTRSVPVTS